MWFGVKTSCKEPEISKVLIKEIQSTTKVRFNCSEILPAMQSTPSYVEWAQAALDGTGMRYRCLFFFFLGNSPELIQIPGTSESKV